MTEEQIRRLQAHRRALQGQLDVLSHEKLVDQRVDGGTYRLFADEIQRARAEFPALIPTCRDTDFFSHRGGNEVLYYNVTPMRTYLASVIAKLGVALEEIENTPVTEKREFAFMKDNGLRSILERDYGEIQRAHLTKCWKSVIILCGSAIETILTDLLQHHQKHALTAKAAPKKSDIREWDLKDLIEVAEELKLVSAGVEKLSHPVRQYRNLVHPGNEIRKKLVFGQEEATIAVEVLHILHRDLSK